MIILGIVLWSVFGVCLFVYCVNARDGVFFTVTDCLLIILSGPVIWIATLWVFWKTRKRKRS